MNTNLFRKVGSCSQDNLIAKLTPAAETFGIVIEKLEEATVLKRGTVLARDDVTGKYSVMSAGKVASCVLSDAVEVGTEEDAVGVAYRSGNFNRAALFVAEGYTLSGADEDTLRKYDIILTDMM